MQIFKATSSSLFSRPAWAMAPIFNFNFQESCDLFLFRSYISVQDNIVPMLRVRAQQCRPHNQLNISWPQLGPKNRHSSAKEINKGCHNRHFYTHWWSKDLHKKVPRPLVLFIEQGLANSRIIAFSSQSSLHKVSYMYTPSKVLCHKSSFW